VGIKKETSVNFGGAGQNTRVCEGHGPNQKHRLNIEEEIVFAGDGGNAVFGKGNSSGSMENTNPDNNCSRKRGKVGAEMVIFLRADHRIDE